MAGANPKEQSPGDRVPLTGDLRPVKCVAGKHHPRVSVGRGREAVGFAGDQRGDAEIHSVDQDPVAGHYRQPLGERAGYNCGVRLESLAERQGRVQLHPAVPGVAARIHAFDGNQHRIGRLIRGGHRIGLERLGLLDPLASQVVYLAALFFGRGLAQRHGDIGGDPLAHVAAEAAGKLARYHTGCAHGPDSHRQRCQGYREVPSAAPQVAPGDLACDSPESKRSHLERARDAMR